MPDKEEKVIEIDRPRCSRCGRVKPIEALNGYDPFAPIGQKYKNAYCIKILECDSPEASKILDTISADLKDEN